MPQSRVKGHSQHQRGSPRKEAHRKRRERRHRPKRLPSMPSNLPWFQKSTTTAASKHLRKRARTKSSAEGRECPTQLVVCQTPLDKRLQTQKRTSLLMLLPSQARQQRKPSSPLSSWSLRSTQSQRSLLLRSPKDKARTKETPSKAMALRS